MHTDNANSAGLAAAPIDALSARLSASSDRRAGLMRDFCDLWDAIHWKHFSDDWRRRVRAALRLHYPMAALARAGHTPHRMLDMYRALYDGGKIEKDEILDRLDVSPLTANSLIYTDVSTQLELLHGGLMQAMAQESALQNQIDAFHGTRKR